MKKWLKDITGITAEEEKVQAEKDAIEKQRDPKSYHTRKKEPWVNVLDMKVNKDNIRNGFFELDWNEYFIVELKQNGYGVDGDPEEQIVDRWFRDIVYGMLEEQGQSTDVGAGYINVVPLDKDKSEIS